MGCWSIGLGKLRIEPEVTDQLIFEYFKFSERAEAFQDRYEIFPNPWYFDEDNNLICNPGKYAEPSQWFEQIKVFFEQRGYKIIGDPNIVWEGDKNFDFNKLDLNMKWLDWIRRLYRINCQYLK